jgi:transcriptional regulator of arginine metabolism
VLCEVGCVLETNALSNQIPETDGMRLETALQSHRSEARVPPPRFWQCINLLYTEWIRIQRFNHLEAIRFKMIVETGKRSLNRMASKEHRQKRILEIVSKEPISTQADLVDRLRNDRINVTQATVSRDINELRLVRLPVGKGRHRYAAAPTTSESDVLDELRLRFREFVHDVDRGENIVVVKTADGHATGVAYWIDRLARDEIVGTLAGQDTILLVSRTNKVAESLEHELAELLL